MKKDFLTITPDNGGGVDRCNCGCCPKSFNEGTFYDN